LFIINCFVIIFKITGKIKTATGKPGEIIVNTAKTEKASLIVIGSRGLSKLKRTLVGSVSDFVLHHAHCPVCICKLKE
jgi:nucleotide-binding universal stress UspA family protein